MKLALLSMSALFGLLASYSVSSADSSVVIYTPRGTAVGAIRAVYELSPNEIAAWQQWAVTTYPYAYFAENASRKYNCHSYAWYNQSKWNDIWIDTPNDDAFWNDGSYKLVVTASIWPIPSSVANGAKVSYVSSDHSAIKASSVSYLSKWGPGPLMLHRPEYSPYASSTVRYYQ